MAESADRANRRRIRTRWAAAGTETPDPADNRSPEVFVIVLGIILILVGYLLPVPSIIVTIGWILLVVGLILTILGAVGRGVGGRKTYF